MAGHRRPAGRPVHPECPQVDSRHRECLCDELWDYWDGTGKELDRRIEVAELQESRTRAARRLSQGTSPDVDLAGASYPTGEADYDEDFAVSGFWKESEYLKTTRGND